MYNYKNIYIYMYVCVCCDLARWVKIFRPEDLPFVSWQMEK